MGIYEVGGSAFPYGGRATEAQPPPTARSDGDRAPYSTDQHEEQASWQDPQDGDVVRALCTTDQQEEREHRQEPQDEAQAALRRRTSFKTLSVPSRTAERGLPSQPIGRPCSVERRDQPGFGYYCSFDFPLVPSAVQATWTLSFR